MKRHLPGRAGALAALLLATWGPSGSHAAGPWRADATNTEGWRDMSPAERVEHQRRMRSFASLEECAAYQAAQRQRVRHRGGREGRPTPPPPLADGCEQLHRRGHWP